MARHQEFELADHRPYVPARLAALRAMFPAIRADALLMPRSDAYLAEFIAEREERLAWMTGFTGSAGTCLLLPDRAILFLDGRYLEQGSLQTDPSLFEIVDVRRNAPHAWIQKQLCKGARVAVDPWLHSIADLRRLKRSGVHLRRLASNPVDALWTDRPAPRWTQAHAQPIELAGEESHDKRRRIAATLAGHDLAGVLVASPESVCWLFNLRGNDTPHTPVIQARALLREDGQAVLLIDPSRICKSARSNLGEQVQLAPPRSLAEVLANLSGQRLGLTPSETPDRLREMVTAAGARPVDCPDPVAIPKAVKNSAELEGMRRAHRLDGAAVVNLLAWLDRNAGKRNLTEIDVVEELERQRIATGELCDIAFPTISASGANAAFPHYRVSRATDRRVRHGELLLIDSGGQYRTGTTDVTRTIALGEIPHQARTAYTLVLRAMIRLSTLEFPDYATGIALDAITREVLWREGMDYAHGTGHGVGACLNVHEGPFSLSPLGKRNAQSLRAGLVLSNEPAVYVPGSFGVRIENLLACFEVAPARDGARARLAFETLTLVPIDVRPVRPALLERSDCQWLDAYHARVLDVISPLVDSRARSWLQRACRPIRLQHGA